MDSSCETIVSMLPYDLREVKPGLTPNEFFIPGKGSDEFSLTIIPSTVFFLVNPDPLSDSNTIPNIPVPVAANKLASAIIMDYVNALIEIQQPDVVPGLFHVVGDHKDKKSFSVTFNKELQHYKECQIRWFTKLTNLGEDTWAKTRSPMGISDIQRLACKELGYKRDWLNPVPYDQMSKCPVCMNEIKPGALKCHVCGHILDKTAFDKLIGAQK